MTLAGASQSSASVFPDLRGLGARDALRTLVELGMTARLDGVGLVFEQDPPAGSAIDRGATATLWLARDANAAQVGAEARAQAATDHGGP